jgi:aryl-alcohol dehydrogenase-like predicted oxidoreductase
MPRESRPADARLRQTAIRVHHLLQNREGIQLMPSDLSRAATRREALILAADLGIAAVVSLLTATAATAEPEAAILTRPIPGTGELLPAIGLGTGINFGDDNDLARRAVIAKVVRTLVAGGGSVIDTASAYGPAETVIGAICAEEGLRARIFIATKLEPEELPRADLWQGSVGATVKGIVNTYVPALTHHDVQGSLRRLRTDRIDLMQVHEVSRAAQSLAPLREWKAQGLIRYTGITTSNVDDFSAVEAVLRREKPDFLQVNYSLGDREAEKRLLPAAAELGVGVLINMPFGQGVLLRAVRGTTLPVWASNFAAASWGQFFLKYVLANPTVTAVIPGTANPEHMADNLAAGHGALPDMAMRKRMVELVQSFG